MKSLENQSMQEQQNFCIFMKFTIKTVLLLMHQDMVMLTWTKDGDIYGLDLLNNTWKYQQDFLKYFCS